MSNDARTANVLSGYRYVSENKGETFEFDMSIMEGHVFFSVLTFVPGQSMSRRNFSMTDKRMVEILRQARWGVVLPNELRTVTDADRAKGLEVSLENVQRMLRDNGFTNENVHDQVRAAILEANRCAKEAK